MVKTDKQYYNNGEPVLIEITNLYDTAAYYYHCSSYDGISPSISIYKNNDWTGYASPLCNGFQSFCCLSLPPGDKYADTLNAEFKRGTYRIEYLFVIGSGNYKPFYSNIFNFE